MGGRASLFSFGRGSLSRDDVPGQRDLFRLGRAVYGRKPVRVVSDSTGTNYPDFVTGWCIRVQRFYAGIRERTIKQSRSEIPRLEYIAYFAVRFNGYVNVDDVVAHACDD